MDSNNEQPTSNTVRPYVRKSALLPVQPDEVARLIAAAGKLGRQGQRDQTLLNLICRHGLRVSEAVDARWTDFDLEGHGPKDIPSDASKAERTVCTRWTGTRRLPVHKLRASQEPGTTHLFLSERGRPLSADMVNKILNELASTAAWGTFTPTC